jgi:hypothetical protein
VASRIWTIAGFQKSGGQSNQRETFLGWGRIDVKRSDDSPEKTLQRIFERINEPIIPMGSIKKWLDRFGAEDRDTALLLLNNIEYHSQPRIRRETRALHQKLCDRLAESRFDVNKFHDVDFSREFTCKSGDVVSYIYRKSNLIPSIDFKTFDLLTRETSEDPERFRNRALVILDDYIGTGSQLIFQFIGLSDEDVRVVNSYKKTYLVCYVIHEKALENFRLLQNGRIEELIRIEQEQFPYDDFSKELDFYRRTLTSLDWRNFELVYLEEEKPLFSPDNRTLSDEEKTKLGEFLRHYSHEGYAGTSYLLGHHTFFFGAPNSLPELLWPLFKRVEDLSIYPEQPAGIEEAVTGYNIEDESS